ncbi:hypothetical protein [Cognatiluteimonas telluris]|jgi:hypothetical protein|uniref:hypothetical protein n=1 Tax=Cognatiluteimonas telluris TaxID=1104775 RepID=UPI001FAF8E93|nr:hypothetical protein [Lysobacter telluris]
MSLRTPLAALAMAVLATLPAMARAQDASNGYQQALEAGWNGRYGDALARIDAYLATHPDDRAAQLDRARFLAWRGDYAAANTALSKFPDGDAEAAGLRARTLAWAGRRDAALALNTPLYEATPDDYDLAWTQALALHQGEWPQRALPALAMVQSLKPDSADTRSLRDAVRLPLFSMVSMPLSIYSDSDDIEIRSIGAGASLWLGDQWRLLADGLRRAHSAPATGPFAPLGGGNSVDETRAGVGLRYAPSPEVAVEGWLGRSHLDDDTPATDDATIGRLSLSQRVNDSVSYTLTADRDRIDASPRALAVVRNGLTADLHWTPGLRDTVSGRASLQDFDDDNRRQSLLLDYRHATWRGDHVMFDLGGQAEWQHNTSNTGNGYYSPDRYVRVAPQASAYVGLSPDAGLYLSAALGVQRDETFDSWKRAGDVNAELTLGIYSPWQLVARVGYSQRLNQFGRYEGRTGGLELRYRFCAYRAGRCP